MVDVHAAGLWLAGLAKTLTGVAARRRTSATVISRHQRSRSMRSPKRPQPKRSRGGRSTQLSLVSDDAAEARAVCWVTLSDVPRPSRVGVEPHGDGHAYARTSDDRENGTSPASSLNDRTHPVSKAGGECSELTSDTLPLSDVRINPSPAPTPQSQ